MAFKLFLNENRIWEREKLVHHYNAIEYFHNLIKKSSNKAELLTVEIQLLKLDQPEDYVSTDIDESYSIEIAADKSISFRCKNYVSFVRALNIFTQLI